MALSAISLAINRDFSEILKEINHTGWAIQDAADFCDVIRVNSLHGLPPSHFCRSPFVYTMHHGHDQAVSEFYSYHPDVHFVTISNFQHWLEAMPSLRELIGVVVPHRVGRAIRVSRS